jgi:CRISPR/Cas system-associated protein endoribonuclease Cas2
MKGRWDDGYKKSRCELVEEGYLRDQKQVYKKLVKKPKYICGHCGRVARKKRNSCHPEKI